MSTYIAHVKQWLTRARMEELIGNIEHIRSFVVARVKRFGLNTVYWGGVIMLGVLISGITLHAIGYGIEPQPTNAVLGPIGTVAFQAALTFLAWNYMFFIGIAAILAFILQVVIGYPWSPFWTGFSEASGVAETVVGSVGSVLGASNYSSGGFINISSVVFAWKAVRDICNLFFSIILLIIALTTVLNLEAFKWQDMLKKLLIFAVLINFSRTICGFFTDAATVAMATFGEGIGQNFAGAILGQFNIGGLGRVLDAVPGGPTDGSATETQVDSAGIVELIGALFAAGFVIMTATGVFAAFIVMLILRIVMIWLLVILSPLAYVTRILPFTTKYSSEWWERFGQAVLLGPLITFFLYLTILMLNGGTQPAGIVNGALGGAQSDNNIPLVTADADTNAAKLGATGNTFTDGLTKVNDPELQKLIGTTYDNKDAAYGVMTPSYIAQFILAAVALMASLAFSMRLAGEAGELAGKAQGALSDVGKEGIRRGSQTWSSRVGGWSGAAQGKKQYGRALLYNRLNTVANTLGNPVEWAEGRLAAMKAEGEMRAKKSDNDFLEQSVNNNLGIKPPAEGFANKKEEEAFERYARKTRALGAYSQNMSAIPSRERAFGLLPSARSYLTETKDDRELKGMLQELNGVNADIQNMDQGDFIEPLKNIQSKNKDLFNELKGVSGDRDKFIAKLRANNEAPEVKAALEALTKAEEWEEDPSGLSVNPGDAGFDEAVSGRLAQFDGLANEAGANGDRASERQFRAARSALQAARTSGTPIKFSDLKVLLQGKGISENAKKAYDTTPHDGVMAKAEEAASKRATALREQRERELGDVRNTAPLIIGGQAIADENALLAGMAGYAPLISSRDQLGKRVKSLGAKIAATRPRLNAGVAQANNAYYDEIQKETQDAPFQDLYSEFVAAVSNGNHDVVKVILRRAMKEKMMPMVLQGWMPDLVRDQDAINEIFVNEIDGRANDQSGKYSAEERKQYGSMIRTEKDENGNDVLGKDGKPVRKVIMDDSAEMLDVVGHGLLKGRLGLGDVEVGDFMMNMTNLAWASDQLKYMGMYSKDSARGAYRNPKELQAMIAASVNANKTPLQLMTMAGAPQMLVKDENGNFIDYSEVGKEVMKKLKPFLSKQENFRSVLPALSEAIHNSQDLQNKLAETYGKEHIFLEWVRNPENIAAAQGRGGRRR